MGSQRTLIIGAVLGVVAAVLVNFYINARVTDSESVQVYRLLPDRAVASGTVLSEDMVEWVGLPSEYGDVLQHAVPATDEAMAWITGRPVTRDVSAGSLLLYEYFEEDTSERFTGRIGEGMRAFTFPVDASSSVSYFVEPGARVDILATMKRIEMKERKAPAGAAKNVPAGFERVETVASKTLLQNVRVLAVGQATTRGAYLGEANASDGRRFNTVTVEVTPEQAEKLVFALEHSTPKRALILVLRNPADEKVVPLRSVEWTSFDRIQ